MKGACVIVYPYMRKVSEATGIALARCDIQEASDVA